MVVPTTIDYVGADVMDESFEIGGRVEVEIFVGLSSLERDEVTRDLKGRSSGRGAQQNGPLSRQMKPDLPICR